MSFGGFNNNQHQTPMAEINVTPMVDVMLVLLVIFMITAPLLTHSIKLDLPKATSAPTAAKSETITISIDPQGKLFWNNAPITIAELNNKMAIAGQSDTKPELHLRADKNSRYEIIATIMSTAQENNITKIGFVTESKK